MFSSTLPQANQHLWMDNRVRPIAQSTPIDTPDNTVLECSSFHSG